MIASYLLIARSLVISSTIVQGHSLLAGTQEPILPAEVQACVSRKSGVMAPFKFEAVANPYYLRGDFDGDGRPDYAIWMRGRNTNKAGIILCHSSGYVTVLGGDTVHRPPFSDLPADQFLSDGWCVISRSEAMRRLVRRSLPLPPVGEVILMPWEDGEGLVYYDGTRYRWRRL